MKKINKSRIYPVLVLSMLTMLLVSSGIYVRSTTNQSLQSLEDSPVTLQIMAENNILSWNITWGGIHEEQASDVAVDTSGSVYCVGYTYSFGLGTPTNPNLALVKVASDGMWLWNTTWGGADADYGTDVAVDASGNVYCVGYTNSFGAGVDDLALVKYNSAGIKLWNITWGGTNGDSGNGVAVDASGIVYCVGGTSSFGAGNADFALVKFAPNGTRLWNTTWGGGSTDFGYGMTVDASGNVYCVGYTDSFGAGDLDMALVKFAPNGTRLWNTTWGGAGTDYCEDIAVDTSGSVYCVGRTSSFGAGGSDMALVKVAPNGTRLWNITWGGASFDDGEGVSVDTSGFIYCVGESGSFGSGPLIKFDSNGRQLWNTTLISVGDIGAYGVAVDTSGSIYCVGVCGVSNSNFVLVKFGSPIGGTEWLLILLLVLIPVIGVALGVFIFYRNKRIHALS